MSVMVIVVSVLAGIVVGVAVLAGILIMSWVTKDNKKG